MLLPKFDSTLIGAIGVLSAARNAGVRVAQIAPHLFTLGRQIRSLLHHRHGLDATPEEVVNGSEISVSGSAGPQRQRLLEIIGGGIILAGHGIGCSEISVALAVIGREFGDLTEQRNGVLIAAA